MYKFILFDLDGTLTNPKTGIVRSIQYALARFGIRETDEQKLQSFIGPPLLDAFKQGYGMDEGQAREAVLAYRERYEAVGMFENEVIPGIPEMLSTLKEEGHVLALATSKPTVYAEKILTHFHMADVFTAICGSELDGRNSDKAEVIAAALSALGRPDVGQVVMVGDRKYDILGARQHHVDAIGVLFGFGSEQELCAAKPTAMVRTVGKLSKFLRGVMQ
ncbi:5'-nucleotidase [Alicyclobacillus contaminans]|uniref:HAD family hydrolase n=1 Tax=Alicyclobacillus contaminans TaxID=392016 RepID=UPI000403F6DD|nr:HAD family hydrolase [Alicyclobacillus contaminans]GMA52205.1 5'-nucleotidase [Alicyclobacillus contaminans]